MGDGREGDDLVRAFELWAAGERVGTAAENRARQRWLVEQAASTATLSGILVDLAEQMAAVTIVVGEHTCAGRVVGVGRDFCVVTQTSGRPAVISIGSISSLSPSQPGWSPSGGDRTPALQLSFSGALAALAEQALPVGVRTRSAIIDGELLSVGEDLITLRLSAPARRLVHVPLAAITLCEVR